MLVCGQRPILFGMRKAVISDHRSPARRGDIGNDDLQLNRAARRFPFYFGDIRRIEVRTHAKRRAGGFPARACARE